MSDFQTEMNRVVEEFVAQITELATRAAVDTLESALGRRGAASVVDAAAAPAAGARAPSAPRTELDQLGESFHSFVAKHPGLRIEQINKQLGTTTKDLALPIRKLIADGSLKTKGKKRSTTYFAGEQEEVQAVAELRESRTRSRTGCSARPPNARRPSRTRRRSTDAGNRRRGARMRDQIRTAARALIALGCRAAARSSILGFNRPEWVILDHAAMMAGGAPAGIYTTCSAEEVQYIVHHSRVAGRPRRERRRSSRRCKAQARASCRCSSWIVHDARRDRRPAIRRRPDLGRLPREGRGRRPSATSTSGSTRSSRATSRR